MNLWFGVKEFLVLKDKFPTKMRLQPLSAHFLCQCKVRWSVAVCRNISGASQQNRVTVTLTNKVDGDLFQKLKKMTERKKTESYSVLLVQCNPGLWKRQDLKLI